ncbi:hypothetical protein KGA66_15595 [Actinocrinis puniceicyclus]|uniref:Glycoside hydrolase family 5 domain-containing protein n=1 Tax=Actinocrinis puniceicyclus TaxID=977794 RepID=A0A8J7WLD9_9ACTN|nr:hypothetical protein [Actinocrinis puniceicyclus]MBS2964481.1 hypothetical protein [Actinocrinis puniceicyclus]
MGRSFSAFTTAGYTQPGAGPTQYGNLSVGVSLGSAYQWYFSSLGASQQSTEIARMRAAGITSVRMDVSWDAVEHTQGSYNWSYPALTAAPMLDAGMNVLMILLWSPSWALAVGNNPAVSGDPFPTIAPTDFAAFCGAAAAHFGPLGVSAFEIWNEPNLDKGVSGPLGLGYCSPIGYAGLATAAYSAIHADYVAKPGGAPTPTVVGGALAGWPRLDWSTSPRTASWSAVAAGAKSATVTCSSPSSTDRYKLVTGTSVSVSPSGTAGQWPAGTYVSDVTSSGYVVSPPPWMAAFPAVDDSGAFSTTTENGVFGLGFGYPPDVFLTQAYAAAAGRPMFDALSIHPYAWSLNSFRKLDAGAWGMVPELRQIMIAHGDGAKPVWFTELGAPTGQTAASWSAAAASANHVVLYGGASAEDAGCLVGNQAFPLHSYVASVTPGASWTVVPPTGLALDYDGLTQETTLVPGTTISVLRVKAASANASSITVPGNTALKVWFGDGNGYSGGDGDGDNGYALPSITMVTTTDSSSIAPGAGATLNIESVTLPTVLNGVILKFPDSGIVQCATNPVQTWGTAIPAAADALLNILPPGVLATWPRGSAAPNATVVSSEEQQALIVPYSYEFVVSEPWPFVGPMFVYCWSDTSLGGSAGPFGLTRVDGTAKPALAALTAIAQTGGASPGLGLPGYT